MAAALAGCAAKPASPAATTVTIPYVSPPRGATRPAPVTPHLPATAAAAQAAAVEHAVSDGQPIYCGRGHRRLVALTFDDGPGPDTATVVHQLRLAGAPATFFLIARNVARFPRSPRLERQVGAIGDHTVTHPDLDLLGHAAARAQIAGGRSAALRAAGHPVTLFRPPYEAHDRWIDREVRRQGMAEILWDVDSTDTSSPATDYHEIYRHVRHFARPGSIVLMHENRPQTVRALHAILPMLRRRHLQPVTVPQLLAADPPSATQLDAGYEGCQPGWRPPRAGHDRQARRPARSRSRHE
jgi:peptidoglycan/xylan/chitin deacetylase (PgdA/CDA1 family)